MAAWVCQSGMKRYTYCYDQVLITGDQDDSSYMLRKLQEGFNKWGLTTNMQKTEYMVVRTYEADDLDIGNASVKRCNTFKYLGVTLASNGKSNVDIANKIAQGRRAIRQQTRSFRATK